MNYKRKLLPVEPYEVDALESWLSDCSAKGLHLEKINTIFATFSETEPKHLSYRLVAKEDSDCHTPTPKDSAHYKELGWKFIASLSRYFYIYAAEEGTAELAIDPIEESKHYTRFTGKEETPAKQFALHAFSAALVLFYIWMDLKKLLEKTPYELVEQMDLPFAALPLAVLGGIFTTQRARGFRHLQKELSAGNPRTHEVDWQDFQKTRRHKLYYISQVFYIALFLLPLLPFAFRYSEKPISEVRQPLPQIALADLENHPNFYPIETYFQKDSRAKSEWWEREANRVFAECTIGAPIQLSYNQAGIVAGKTDAYGDPYQPVLWVEYLKFSPFVSAKEYVDSYLEQPWHSDWNNEILTDTPFDYAVLSKDTDKTVLFLVFEDALLKLSYSYGDADLTAHYDLYLEALYEYHKT